MALLFGTFAGCAGFQTSGEFQAGRQAFLVNQPERALGHFLAAAERDPDYVFRAMYFSEGIWTYVGRTQYLLKRYGEARQSLEHALAKSKDDYLARLYLGLTIARMGDVANGRKEIVRALKDIHDWLEYIERTRPSEGYWDPTREIRNTIEKDVDRIDSRDFSPDEFLADAEWAGQRMETEIDRARFDERRRYERDFDRRRRLSVGVGVGF